MTAGRKRALILILAILLGLLCGLLIGRAAVMPAYEGCECTL